MEVMVFANPQNKAGLSCADCTKFNEEEAG